MTVFLTPARHPFYAGTYFPPDDRWGRPGFSRLLSVIAESWDTRRADIEAQGADISDELRRDTLAGLQAEPVTPQVLDDAFRALRPAYDAINGGFGGAPKFPQPMTLEFMLRCSYRTGSADGRDMVLHTLRCMAHGGIYDQLGGGFHRYSTDDGWLVPHFEKMLYDNAQLAVTYLHAWQISGEPLFRRVVEETLDYVRREMTAPDGGFYSSQDADSEGEEGRFFVWTPAELAGVLGTDAAAFAAWFDVTERGNFEGRSILHVADPDAAPPDGLAAMRRALFEARSQRSKPARDDKVIASWNGLMLAAFAEAGAVLGRADYLQAARNNAEFLWREMRHDGRLVHSGMAVPEEDGVHPPQRVSRFRASTITAFLDDCACCAAGLLHLYEADGGVEWLRAAQALADEVLLRFTDGSDRFFSTPDDAEKLIDRPRDWQDNAVPSGSSMAAEVLLRTSIHTGDGRYSTAAVAYLRRMASVLRRHPLAIGRLLCAADASVGPDVELAIVGPRDDPRFDELAAEARATYRPNLVIALGNSEDESAERPPLLLGRRAVAGAPAAYVCVNGVCGLPVTSTVQLRQALDSAADRSFPGDDGSGHGV